MTFVALLAVVIAVGLAAAFLAGYASRLLDKQARFFEQRVREQDEAEEGRRLALYKQQKQMARTVAASDKAVRKMSDEARNLHENARLMHERADALARDAKAGR